MRNTLLIFLLLIFTTSLFSQFVTKDSLKVINAQYDSIDNIQLIPTNALDGDYDVLVIDRDYDLYKAIDICWRSNYIDGSYDIVITSKQIYLRSSHENPNPNDLYWISSISREQFDLIKHYLDKQNSRKLNAYTHENSCQQSFFYNKYKKEKLVDDDWTDLQYENFIRIMRLINKPLKAKNISIKIPDLNSFRNTHPLILVSELKELNGHIKIVEID